MPIVIAWARKRNLVDKPDARKIHKIEIARVGGIAIFVGAMLAIMPVLLVENHLGETFRGQAVQIAALLLASTVMFGVGLCDDIKGARLRTKLAAQVIAALVVCMAGIYIHTITIRDLGVIHLGWFGCVITFVWIIGITNAINLIDGLDGLAGGISAIACGAIALMSILQGNVVLAVIMLALFGSLAGFLLFNFHPAKIFMGDCGSLFLGFIIATSSILTAAKSEALVGIGLPILVLGIPIFDTLFSILRRFISRHSIMSPDRGHFHHRLLDMGLKQHQVAIVAYVITGVITSFGLIMLTTRSGSSIVLLLACLSLLLLVFRLIGAVELHRSLDGLRQRITISQHQRMERKSFEEAQILFGDAKTFDQWWGCMCKAAQALEFSQLCLTIDNNGNGKQVRDWRWQEPPSNSRTEQGDQILEDLLEVKVPLKSKTKGHRGNIEIQVMRNGSLESAGRRISLFSRLAEEYGLDGIPYGSNTEPGDAVHY